MDPRSLRYAGTRVPMLNLPGVVIRDSDRGLSTWGGGVARISHGPQSPVSDCVMELILELVRERRSRSEAPPLAENDS
jgi:hypothetical protein